MNFRIGTRGGKTQKGINVKTNDPENSMINLKIIANVEVLLNTEPRTLNFGRVKKARLPAIKYASLVGKEKDNVKITKTRSQNKNIKIEINPDGFDGDKQKNIKITLLPSMKVGKFFERIRLETSNKKVKQLMLPLHGTILGNITVQPTHLSFRLDKKLQAVEKTITLKSSSTSFKILDVKSSIPELSTDVETIKKGSKYIVKARLKDGTDKKFLRGTIKISTDDKEQKEIEIKVYARQRKQHGKKKIKIEKINKHSAKDNKGSK